jgi:2-polyprenyl-3-methyl-5-hydroxy-6-metoxy-1,4-benzoquinol methylase
MEHLKNARETVLKASRSFYAHLGYYEERTRTQKATNRELDFLEFAFRTHATHKVRDVFDVSCGSGRHVLGLAHRGYQCTGQDYTPEQVQIAKTMAKREGVSIKLLQGDATKVKYESEFDAVLALYALFLLPDDDSVLTCLRQIHRALKSGRIMVCNIANPFYEGENWFSLKSIQHGHYLQEIRVPGMRYTSIDRVQDFDPPFTV